MYTCGFWEERYQVENSIPIEKGKEIGITGMTKVILVLPEMFIFFLRGERIMCCLYKSKLIYKNVKRTP